MEQSQFFNNIHGDGFFELPNILGESLLKDADIEEMDYDSLLEESINTPSFFMHHKVLLNGKGRINHCLLDAAKLASHILLSEKYISVLLESVSMSYKFERAADIESEITEITPIVHRFLQGRFILSVDDFLNSNAYAIIYRDGPKRFIYLNRFLVMALDSFTDERHPSITESESYRRGKLAVIFLAIKLVHEVSHWVHTWMRGTQFYARNEEFTNTVTPEILDKGFIFSDLGNHIESRLFGAYTTVIEPEHPLIPSHFVRFGIIGLQLAEFSEKKMIYYRLTFDVDVTKINISSADLSKGPDCLKFGIFIVSVRSKSVPASVAQRAPPDQAESSRRSDRQLKVSAESLIVKI